jgi:hypothetical protein
LKINNIKNKINIILDRIFIKKMPLHNSCVVFMLGDDYADADDYDYMNNPVYVSAYDKALHETSMYDKIPMAQPNIIVRTINKSVVDLKQNCATVFDKILNLFEYLTYF